MTKRRKHTIQITYNHTVNRSLSITHASKLQEQFAHYPQILSPIQHAISRSTQTVRQAKAQPLDSKQEKIALPQNQLNVFYSILKGATE